ncbi:hypothetical protein T4B_10946, partial [Trichinella pseudospiralis]
LWMSFNSLLVRSQGMMLNVRLVAVMLRRCCSKNDTPLKFSETPAFHRRHSRSPPVIIPEYQFKDSKVRIVEFISATISLTVFIVYFARLREPNDLDMALDVSSPEERLEQIERQLLKDAIRRGNAKGLDVTQYEKRIAELDG